MADLFTITAPLLVRYPNGDQKLIADKFRHASGMICAEPFWLEHTPPMVFIIDGEVKGEGPWKVGDVIVRLLSCGDTDLAMEWAQWQQFLQSCPETHVYHNDAEKKAIISKMSFPDE